MTPFSHRDVIALRRALSASRSEVMTDEQIRAVLDVAISTGYVTATTNRPPEPVLWLLYDHQLDTVMATVAPLIPDVEPTLLKDALPQAVAILRALADAGAFADGPSPMAFEDNGRRVTISFTHPDGTALSVQTAFLPEDFAWEPDLYADDLDEDAFEVERVRRLVEHFAVRAAAAANAKIARHERDQAKG